MSDTVFLGGKLANPILKVGLDIDKSIAHNDPVWAKFMSETTCVAAIPHRRIEATETLAVYDYFRRICNPCFEVCMNKPELALALECFPLSQESIADLHDLGVEFHVITARPSTLHQATFEWLEKTEISKSIASVTITEQKIPVCKDLDLDFHIDDAPYIYDQFHADDKLKTKLLFYSAEHNLYIESRSPRMDDWSSIRQYLEKEISSRKLALAYSP